MMKDKSENIKENMAEVHEKEKKDKKNKSNGKVVLTKQEFEALKEKAEERDEYYKKWMQVHAEYENTRKRLEKEKSDHIKFANESLVMQLLPLLDNFDFALAAMEKADDKNSMMDGIKLIAKGFHRLLEDNGVEKVKSEGEDFDPNVHEAVFAVETKEYPEGTVVEEVRSGYKLKDRLIRPAQVKVAKPGKEKDEEEK